MQQQGKVLGTWTVAYSQNHATAQGYRKYLYKVLSHLFKKQKKHPVEKVN